MNSTDCYKLLELSFGSSHQEVRATRRKLLMQWHPDKVTHNPALQAIAEEQSKRINMAADFLLAQQPFVSSPPPPSQRQPETNTSNDSRARENDQRQAEEERRQANEEANRRQQQEADRRQQEETDRRRQQEASERRQQEALAAEQQARRKAQKEAEADQRAEQLRQRETTKRKKTIRARFWWAAFLVIAVTHWFATHPAHRVPEAIPQSISQSHYQKGLAYANAEVVAKTKSQFPFKWGPYTIRVVKNADASSTYPQEVHICNAAGKILWEDDADSGASVSECSITGSSIKELDLVPLIEGNGGYGSDCYFSRANGLHLLFSYGFGDDAGITGFKNYDHALRPEVRVGQSVVDFDGFNHSQRQAFSCVYKWNGSQYVNATTAFPHDALAAASISKAAYLRHWQNNPKADYSSYEDNSDRVDAIGYWANAMAIGQGDIAKSWLLDHANPQLALHLLRIEKELQKYIPAQGEPLKLSMGNGKNLDPAASR